MKLQAAVSFTLIVVAGRKTGSCVCVQKSQKELILNNTHFPSFFEPDPSLTRGNVNVITSAVFEESVERATTIEATVSLLYKSRNTPSWKYTDIFPVAFNTASKHVCGEVWNQLR